MTPPTITRPNDDHYRTPPECFRALMSVEHFIGGIHECCAGDGIGAAAMAETRGDIVATTISPPPVRYYPVEKQDALQMSALLAPNVVTNPPYGYLYGRRLAKAGAATAILQHLITLQIARGRDAGLICLLMDIRYRLSEGRTLPGGILHDYPPARIHAFADRVTMYPSGLTPEASLNNGVIPFGWFVWEYPFFRPGEGTLLTTRLMSRDFRLGDDQDRFGLPTIGGKQRRRGAT